MKYYCFKRTLTILYEIPSCYFLWIIFFESRKSNFCTNFSILLIWIAGCKMWYVEFLLLLYVQVHVHGQMWFFRKIFFNQSSNFRFTDDNRKLRLIYHIIAKFIIFIFSHILEKSLGLRSNVFVYFELTLLDDQNQKRMIFRNI